MFGSHLEILKEKIILTVGVTGGGWTGWAGVGGVAREREKVRRGEKRRENRREIYSCPTGPPRGALGLQQGEAGVLTQLRRFR